MDHGVGGADEELGDLHGSKSALDGDGDLDGEGRESVVSVLE